MKNIIKNLILAGGFILFIASPVMALASPQTVSAAGCTDRVSGIPTWYRGLSKEENGSCVIVSPEEAGGLQPFIWRIVLNVIEMALVITAYIAFFFILYGGFLFITGGGNSAQVEKARKSIFNAVIGLVISLGAVAITNMIFSLLIGNGTPNSFGVSEITPDQLVKNILNLFYYVVGIISVIVIIIAGLMYATSMGDSSRVTRSKNMILYAIIGLGVVIAAYAITNFIILRF